jgi:hypothetical protein
VERRGGRMPPGARPRGRQWRRRATAQRERREWKEGREELGALLWVPTHRRGSSQLPALKATTQTAEHYEQLYPTVALAHPASCLAPATPPPPASEIARMVGRVLSPRKRPTGPPRRSSHARPRAEPAAVDD